MREGGRCTCANGRHLDEGRGSSANGRQLDKGIDTRGQQLSNSVYLLLILKAT